MFELYNAHLRAKPVPGTVYTAKLVEARDCLCGTHPPLPANSVFKVYIGNSCTHKGRRRGYSVPLLQRW